MHNKMYSIMSITLVWGMRNWIWGIRNWIPKLETGLRIPEMDKMVKFSEKGCFWRTTVFEPLSRQNQPTFFKMKERFLPKMDFPLFSKNAKSSKNCVEFDDFFSEKCIQNRISVYFWGAFFHPRVLQKGPRREKSCFCTKFIFRSKKTTKSTPF